MIFSRPELPEDVRSALAELDELRQQLGERTRVANRWLGQLRRQVRASSAQSSVSIEGFEVPDREAVALVEAEQTPAAGDDDRLALACYARAMDHVGTMAEDPSFRWLDRVILDVHFDACWFQRDKRPGSWRTGPIQVTAPGGGGVAYVGPDASQVPELMSEVVDWLEHSDRDEHVAVRAAMAHLHVVSVHPFQDGNGRIARIVQSLVLARDGLLAPEFSSIEEYLGRHTPAYYEALTSTQGGTYRPERDPTGWIAFCVHAHIDQARRRLAQIAEAGARWSFLEDLVAQRGWPDRLAIALEQSMFDGTDRARYSTEADVSLPTSSNDLRRLVDAGLVIQRGQGRSTRYTAGNGLREGAASWR